MFYNTAAHGAISSKSAVREPNKNKTKVSLPQNRGRKIDISTEFSRTCVRAAANNFPARVSEWWNKWPAAGRVVCCLFA